MWWVLLGCQEPFGADRHDLVGFRVAAVAADPPGGPPGTEVTAHAALVVDGRLWSDEAVDLAWAWLPDDDADTVATWAVDGAVATGPRPTLAIPDGLARLGLVARDAAGDEYRAFIDLGGTIAPDLAGFDLATVDLDPSAASVADLDVDARARLTATAAGFVPEGGLARLTATGTLGDATVRFMATSGTFLELDPRTADWAAGDLAVDDTVDFTPSPAGWSTILGLAVDGRGGNDFLATDVWIGEPPPGLWTTSGRWLGGATGSGLLSVVLASDPSAPTGLSITSATPVDAPDDFGTASLACEVPVDGPFDPQWLVDGTCLRDALVGATVVVEAR